MGAARLTREDRPALLGLVALVLLLFAEALAPDRTFWYRDIQGYWSAQAEAFVKTVAEGSPPLWNPYFSFGLPMLPDPSYQVLYPFTWLNLLMRPPAYYRVYVLFHALGAGLGLYLLARRLGLGRAAAYLAAAVWVSSGPFLVVLSHTHHFAGAAWIPWVVLALDFALERGSVRAALALGAAAAGQVLAGSGDVCLMTGFLCAGYSVLHLARRPGEDPERWRKAAVATSVSIPAAALLSAAQWLPTLSILSAGFRLRLGEGANLYWSLHPVNLADLLVERLVTGLPLNEVARAALYESREPLFSDIYVGAPCAVLVILGLTSRWDRRVAFAGLGLVLSLLCALGRYTLFYPWLTQFTPLSLFRFPSKYLIATGFAWALAAGLGAERLFARPVAPRRFIGPLVVAMALAAALLGASLWMSGGPEVVLRQLAPGSGRGLALSVAARRLAIAAGSVGLAAVLALFGVGKGRAAARVALVALVLGDLVVAGRRVNPLAPAELLAATPRVARAVPPGSRLYVGMKRPMLWLGQQLAPAWKHPWAMALGWQDLVWPHLGARWGLLGSYDGDATGLGPPLLSNLTLIVANAEGGPLAERLLRVGGVDYVVSADDDAPWQGLELVEEIPSVFRRPLRLLRVPGTLPKAYVVGRGRTAYEPDSVWLLGDPGFDPAREVLLAGPAGTDAGHDFVGQLRVLWRRADGLGLEVDASSPGYAVFLETYYPGWRARVDGVPAVLLRANVLFQAVPVPAGRHVVTFEYRPPAALWGAALSALGLAAVLGAALVPRARRAGLIAAPKPL